MPEYLVATPLKPSAVRQPYTLGGGIAIRQLTPILWNQAIVRNSISEREREDISNTGYWLCASKKEPPFAFLDERDGLYEVARHAMYALQIIHPSGGKNVYLKFQVTPKGYDNIGSQQPKEMNSTLLGRLTSVEDEGLGRDFEKVNAGVARAFKEEIVRLQNPIILLEHALQIGTVELGMLFCVMGLDMLLMAGKKRPFVERLGGILGSQSRVFPKTRLGNQPIVSVGEVITDLYEFRNIIAHGQRVPAMPYQQKYDLKDDGGGTINPKDYYHAELLLEGALFMLARVLRVVFVEELVDFVKDESKWRQKLKLYESRYQKT